VLTIFSIEDQPINSLGGLGVILCGIPIYLFYQRRRPE
jgi:uncharacterized iron-regulated membrane protein